MQGFGVVKAVPSGDTIVIYGNSKTGIAPEMQLTLAYCYAPRVARGPDSIEEPYGWESREFLRKKIIGQTIKFKVDVIDRTFATISMNDVNINEMMVENGWCKVRAENKVSGGDQELLEELLQLEETARSHSAGVWKSPAPPSRVVQYNLEDAEQFFKENKDTPLIGLIEQVRDGSTLRIFLPDTMTMINFHLAGIQAPKMEISAKTANDAPTPGEPYSKEAKQFVEIRLLNRSILVYLDGLDKFNNFYGHIEHPKGDISFELLKNGLAKCVDWSLNYRPSEDAVQMRTFETEARQKKIGIWKSTKEPKPASASHTARILEVVSGDTLVISNEPQNPLAQGQRVSLSSIRAPRLGSKKANTKDEDWAAESKETLRKLAIGKEITIKVDYTRTVTGVDGDVKYTYVTAETVGKNSINLAEEMVKRGLATVIRHKPDDDCSPIYDQLLLAEAVAKDAKRCLYNPKGYTHKNAVDLTENSTKAKSFFDFLHRHKTLSATILYMGNASRFRVYVPKENCECVFILEGIKSPSQRVGKEKSEPFAEECLAFARYHFMQREITIEIRGQDKTGNIIGYASMANKKDMGAFLLSNGYASIQEFSIEKCMNKNEYLQLEQQAKTAKKGIWVNYVAPVAKKMEETREETYDGYISYVEDDYVFIQTDRDIQRLKAVESQLENYSTKANVASAVRKNGTFVYYDKQAKNLVEDVKNDKGVKRYSIYFLDYGYRDTTIQGPFYEYSNPEMIPPLVHECRFAFIRLPSSSHDLYDNAYNTYMDIIEEYTLDKKVSIHVLGRNSLNHLLIMVSTPGQPSLNVQLAKAGCVVLDRSTDLQKYPALQNEIRKANDTAINTNTGIYVYGVLDEDE